MSKIIKAQSLLDFFELLAFALDLPWAFALGFGVAFGLGSALLTVLAFDEEDFGTRVLGSGRNAVLSEAKSL